jgi:spermidine synthase
MSKPGSKSTTARQHEALRGSGPLLFATAIFASAFLIFLVQPVVGKRILPWFGGTPAVWTLCLAFYQSMLFFGYAYAHCLIRFARPSLHLGIHAAVVVAALAALPVLPSAAWAPEGAAHPTLRILTMLAANVALPFFVLASTGPLVQAWFTRRYPLHSPYPLYAVSNVGSLLALIIYPFFIEPRLSLSNTGSLWSVAFAITALSVLGCAALARRLPVETQTGSRTEDDSVDTRNSFTVGLWILLAGSSVVALMGITNKLCLDIASVPFLWVLPLATYLLTFIVCFSSERFYSKRWSILLALCALLPTVGQSLLESWLDPGLFEVIKSIHAQIIFHCALLFGLCMIMHGELYRLRPPPRALTSFYLCVSGGGALAGLFVGILAPVVFSDYYEFEVGLVLVGLLLLAACANDPSSVLRANAPRWRWAVVGPLTLVLLAGVGWTRTQHPEELEHLERSFFGVLRVFRSDDGPNGSRVLKHGSTRHGMQFIGETGRRLPTVYYGRATGLGMALALREKGSPQRIGVIGLGIGTLASYGQKSEIMRFYEIDPAVVRIAQDANYFHYLEDSPAEIEIVIGDARLSLANEQDRGVTQEYDFLIVDAFSSDSIPVHLLTREAFVHYSKALAPDGLLMVHVTNRHLDLRPLVTRVGSELAFESLWVWTGLIPDFQSTSAEWILLSRDPSRLSEIHEYLVWAYEEMKIPAEAFQIKRVKPASVGHIALWTDDFSDLFSVMKPAW